MSPYSEIKFDINYDPANLRWNGWGAEGHDFFYADRVPEIVALLAREIGVAPDSFTPTPSVALEDLRMPPARLGDAALKALAGIVGKDAVFADRRMRALYSRGQSYYDLIRLRTNQFRTYTDAVVFPADEKQVVKLLAWCEKNRTAFIPCGGASSVVGGLEPIAGAQKAILTVNLQRMNCLIEVDEISGLATFEAGIFGPQIERILNDRGWTLGHFPQSFEYSTLGGWAAARSAGQQSNRYGKIEEILTAVRMVSPAGEIETLRAPAGATGPDWNQIIAGSEGLLGVITRATVKIHRLPEVRSYFAAYFPDLTRAVAFVHDAVHADFAMARISDALETRNLEILSRVVKPESFGSALKHKLQEQVLRAVGMRAGRCLVIAGFEGGAREVQGREITARELIRKHKGFYGGKSGGQNWQRGRFNMPFLRNHLFERGIGVDTLETAVTYDRVFELHDAVLKALKKSADPCLAMCHLSHSYHEGACLYFTCMFPIDGRDPIAQWKRIKTAASDAVVAAGGNISHHHGVGADHRPWFLKGLGATGAGALKALKANLDPKAILNPGKLFD